MAITRRTFLAESGMVTMALAMRRGMCHAMSHTTPPKFRTQVNVSSLAQFVDPLALPETIQPTGHRPSPDNPAVQLPYYRVAMRQFESKVHRDLKPTRMWGYASSSPGPSFETRSGEGLLVEWVNRAAGDAFPAHRPHYSRRGSGQARSARGGSPAWGQGSAGKRWLSGELVRAGQIGGLPLSQSAGRNHALVSRPCSGH